MTSGCAGVESADGIHCMLRLLQQGRLRFLGLQWPYRPVPASSGVQDELCLQLPVKHTDTMSGTACD